MSVLRCLLCAAPIAAAVGCSAAKPARPDSLAARDAFREGREKPSLFDRLKPKAEQTHLPVWEDRPVADEATLKVAYADYMAGSGNPDAARRSYAEALKIDAEHAGGRLGLARLEAAEGNGEAAGALFAAAARSAPNDAATHAARGEFELSRGRLDEAAGALARAVQLNPEDSASKHRLGIARARQGRVEEARRLFVATVGPAGAAYSLGVVLKDARPDLARAEFARALELRPGMDRAARELAAMGGGLPTIVPAGL